MALTSIPSISEAVAAGPAGTYIVQLAGEPVAAAKPDQDTRLDTRSSAAKQRSGLLAQSRSQALKSVPGVKKLYDYQYTFNGFAARMTPAQAAKMAATPGVKAVVKDEVRTLDTVSTPRFLGLDGATGTWAKQFGNVGKAGEGVIVGIVDSGIRVENPSFAALPEPRPDQAIIDSKWRGTCDPGITCNNKVIGAHWYLSGMAIPAEHRSPLDYDGHGSHTASTAAGNNNVTAVVNGVPVGQISGMAPAARIAAYKVCWEVDNAGNASCSTADSVAAIDQATADGVDVINYSISGSLTTNVDPVAIAFYNAAKAGVFIATSAGNSGDQGASTNAHNAPWNMTVAASTHDRNWSAKTTLGNGASYTGVGLGPVVPSAPLVPASAVGKDGANANEVRLCFVGTLDPAKAAGKIVVCDRGTNGRTDKSQAVKDAGGVGMLLLNTSANSLNADFHFVPTIHLDNVAGAAVRAYLAGASPTASFAAGTPVPGRAPSMAAFSSRGPGRVSNGDLLKPDITAPGVDVLAVVSPDSSNGNGFGTLSGTSMSSPHIAGLGALLKSKHQDWGPMAIKSALMTTASQKDNAGQPIQRDGVNATPFDFGAGHVVPGSAFDPGLVYLSTYNDWDRFLCATEDALKLDCDGVPKRDASSLNYPSIAIGDLPGVQTVTRRVTNVTSTNAIYHLDVEAPPGFTVEVTPTKLVVPAGGYDDYKVKFTRTTAPFNVFQFGSLTWHDKPGHKVRSPIAVRPTPVTVAKEIWGTSAAGSRDLGVDTAFAGTVTASVNGLAAANVTPMLLKNPTSGSFDNANPTTSDHTGKVVVNVAAGADLMKFATFAGEYPEGTDVDLFAYLQTPGGLVQVGNSGGPDAEESISLVAPAAGTYEIYVDLFSLGMGHSDVTINGYDWVLAGSAGNATVSPTGQRARVGGFVTFTLNWSGLEPGKHYLGFVTYGDGTSAVGGTTVRVDP
ncbi:S8 family peptidase [Longispora sp. NPDC051575]|uniref:S8 family peptidase n=1 Tax=Longispora sp. NPDC051575 TaxID=3154943 RepID=UPI00344A5A12